MGEKRRSKEVKISRWLCQELMLLCQRGHEDADGESEGFLLLQVAERLKRCF